MLSLYKGNSSKKSMLIFGGSFDPPHLGHKALIEVVRKQLKPSFVMIIPCYIQPIKGELSASPEHRLNMCREQFQGKEYLISDYEIKKSKPSYTVDTLRYFKTIYPDKQLYFLMGSDSLSCMDKWKEPEEIVRLASLVVVARKNYDLEKIVLKMSERYDIKIEVFNKFQHLASSTNIRKELKKTGSSDQLESGVFNYIKNNDLYRG